MRCERELFIQPGNKWQNYATNELREPGAAKAWFDKIGEVITQEKLLPHIPMTLHPK